MVPQPESTYELILAKLTTLEDVVRQLVHERTVKEWYTTAEVAALLGKAEFTVREWCRLGRVTACKRVCGRGPTQEWSIAHAELERIRNHGLLADKPIGR